MIEIIPAIDLLGGKCVRLLKGDYQKVTEFSDDPVNQAQIWRQMGATRLHLVDLDGAKTGTAINDAHLKRIKAIIDIPIQVGGGIRTIQRAKELIDIGIDRIIVGTIAIEEPQTVEKLAKDNPGKIVLGIDAKEGMVATRGWQKSSNITASELVKRFSQVELAAIICTDISTDGTLAGPNLDFLREIALISHVPVIASGGIGCIADILAIIPLVQYGVNGVITGRAIYDEKIDLEEAIKVTKNQNMSDKTTELRGYA